MDEKKYTVEVKAAQDIEAALLEAKEAYNAAKKAGTNATLSTRTLWLLLGGYCTMAGISIHDAQTGAAVVPDAMPVDLN